MSKVKVCLIFFTVLVSLSVNVLTTVLLDDSYFMGGFRLYADYMINDIPLPHISPHKSVELFASLIVAFLLFWSSLYLYKLSEIFEKIEKTLDKIFTNTISENDAIDMAKNHVSDTLAKYEKSEGHLNSLYKNEIETNRIKAEVLVGLAVLTLSIKWIF